MAGLKYLYAVQFIRVSDLLPGSVSDLLEPQQKSQASKHLCRSRQLYILRLVGQNFPDPHSDHHSIQLPERHPHHR